MRIQQDSRNQQEAELQISEKFFRGKNFIEILNFIADLLNLITITSEKLQNRYSLISSINSIIEKSIAEIKNLRFNDKI